MTAETMSLHCPWCQSPSIRHVRFGRAGGLKPPQINLKGAWPPRHPHPSSICARQSNPPLPSAARGCLCVGGHQAVPFQRNCWAQGPHSCRGGKCLAKELPGAQQGKAPAALAVHEAVGVVSTLLHAGHFLWKGTAQHAARWPPGPRGPWMAGRAIPQNFRSGLSWGGGIVGTLSPQCHLPSCSPSWS